MDFDIDIGYCEYDWIVPGFLICEVLSAEGMECDGAEYKPETFPPPCTASNYTGVIGEN